MDDERGVDDLIELADEIPESLGLSAGLSEIRATARSKDLSVTVDVHGMLVALDVGEAALERGPDALAAEISRLSAEAGTRALQQGMRAVKAGCTPAVTAAIGDALELEDEPATQPPSADAAPSPSPAPRPAPRRPASSDDEEEGFVLKPVQD
ncbi:hypothetical protein GCM10022222_15520 [Amycolatopsis ultiminotia]|uniref:YbaB/EbfC DNA-binding family protein n=1 Tax=Amycolatopsis ultiminotia TaxID=543629 RepID=A0ABP6VFX0_9PSEU